MKTFICSLLILTGVFMVAGSAGDCDGKCMDQANTLSAVSYTHLTLPTIYSV